MAAPHPPDPPSALPRGTRLAEFELLRVLGVGGFGIVYLALDHALEREVAIKEYMPSSLVGRTGALQVSLLSESHAESFSLGLRSFVNEARLLARFDHPSLVKVHRYWEANNTAYMAMPYYTGSNLHAVRRRMDKPPNETWLRSILLPLLGALDRLHREGVYHRDISPDNVILQPDGQPVLLDFGAARRVLSDKSMALTAILKPAYAPIEQYAEAGAVKQGAWTDLYSLGATLHFLLLGRAPAPATTRTVVDEMLPLASQQATLPACSTAFLQCIDWMLQPRPADRPQSVAAVLEALAKPASPAQVDVDWEATQLQAKPVNEADDPAMIDLSQLQPVTRVPPPPADTRATVILARGGPPAPDDATVVLPGARQPGDEPTVLVPRRASDEPTVLMPRQGNDEPTVLMPRQGNDEPTVLMPRQGNDEPTVLMPRRAGDEPTVLMPRPDAVTQRLGAPPPPAVATATARGPAPAAAGRVEPALRDGPPQTVDDGRPASPGQAGRTRRWPIAVGAVGAAGLALWLGLRPSPQATAPTSGTPTAASAPVARAASAAPEAVIPPSAAPVAAAAAAIAPLQADGASRAKADEALTAALVEARAASKPPAPTAAAPVAASRAAPVPARAPAPRASAVIVPAAPRAAVLKDAAAPAPTGTAPGLATSITRLPPAAESSATPSTAPAARQPAAATAEPPRPGAGTAPASVGAAPTAQAAPANAGSPPPAAARPNPTPAGRTADRDGEPVLLQTRALSPGERCEGRVLLALWACIDRVCKSEPGLREHADCVKLRRDQERGAATPR